MAGECQTSNTKDYEGEDDEVGGMPFHICQQRLRAVGARFNEGTFFRHGCQAPAAVLDEGDIALLKTYGMGPYNAAIKKAEDEIKNHQDKVGWTGPIT